MTYACIQQISNPHVDRNHKLNMFIFYLFVCFTLPAFSILLMAISFTPPRVKCYCLKEYFFLDLILPRKREKERRKENEGKRKRFRGNGAPMKFMVNYRNEMWKLAVSNSIDIAGVIGKGLASVKHIIRVCRYNMVCDVRAHTQFQISVTFLLNSNHCVCTFFVVVVVVCLAHETIYLLRLRGCFYLIFHIQFL